MEEEAPAEIAEPVSFKRRWKRGGEDTDWLSLRSDLLAPLVGLLVGYVVSRNEDQFSLSGLALPVLFAMAAVIFATGGQFAWNVWRAGDRLALDDAQHARIDAELSAKRLQSQVEKYGDLVYGSLAFSALEFRIMISKEGTPDRFGQVPEAAAIQVGVVLTNNGRLLLRYNIASISVDIQGKSVQPQLMNTGGLVHASQTSIFRYTAIPNIDMKSPIVGHLEYTANYGSASEGHLKYRSSRKLQFELATRMGEASPADISWTMLDEHEEIIT